MKFSYLLFIPFFLMSYRVHATESLHPAAPRISMVADFYDKNGLLRGLGPMEDEVLIQSPFGGTFRNDSIAKFLAHMEKNFPDRVGQIRGTIAEDDQRYAAVLRDVSFRHSFFHRATYTAIDWFEFDEQGHVIRYYHFFDSFALPHARVCAQNAISSSVPADFPDGVTYDEEKSAFPEKVRESLDSYYANVNSEDWDAFALLFKSDVYYRIPMDKVGHSYAGLQSELKSISAQTNGDHQDTPLQGVAGKDGRRAAILLKGTGHSVIGGSPPIPLLCLIYHIPV